MKNIRVVLDKVFLPACILIYLIVIVSAYKTNSCSFLWYDEAGQFWIAKGLNHDSDPLSPDGNVVEVIRNNRDYNLDPGGFGILLHYWTWLGNGYMWVRTLPFMFFVGVVLSFILLSYRWNKNKYIAVLMGFVPIIMTLIMREMFNIRAYTMEIMGVMVAIIAIDYLKEKISVKRLLLFSLLISFFMTSRYSYIVVAFVTSTYVLWLIYKTEFENKKKFFMAGIYTLPLLLTLVCVYLLSLRFQNPELEELGYLDYIRSKPSILLKNSNLLLFFKLALLIWLCVKLKGTRLLDKYIGLVYVTIVTHFLFFILSALGKHPWGAIESRCVAIATLVIVSTMAFWSEVLNYVQNRIDIKYVVLLFIIFYYINPQYINPLLKSFKENNELNYGEEGQILADFQELHCDNNVKVFVDRWGSPSIRYEFEYGSLKGQFCYPDNFVFAKARKHRMKGDDGKNKISRSEWYKTQPCMNDMMEFDVLIAKEYYMFHPDNSDRWASVKGHECVWYKKSHYEE